jgi:hypothetical protein
MNGLTLNLIGAVLIVAQFTFHFVTFAKTYILFTMHPTTANRLDRTVAQASFGLFAAAMVAYVLTN